MSRPLLLALVFATWGMAALGADGPRITGPAETVFDWRSEACERWDIPDTPARAWRDGDGRTHLVAGSERSRADSGPDLDRLRRDCAVLYQGAGSDEPGDYDDRAWIHAIHADGQRVTALAHVEFHGHRREGLCRSDDYRACWRNAIVELGSDDGGRSFHRVGLVAALPWRYSGEAGRRTGYFNPSNIVERYGYLYAFVFAEATGAQRRGACLLRRPRTGGPGDWWAWDGAGFGVRFVDPYREDVGDPAAHVCSPVAGVTSAISSLVWSEPAGRWLAVTAATLPDEAGRPHTGIHAMQSDDLVTWSAPELLLPVPLLWRRDCAALAAYAYPALLDPDSASPSFETVDGGFWLYLTEMPLGSGCRPGPERDLVRFPVSWPGPPEPGPAPATPPATPPAPSGR